MTENFGKCLVSNLFMYFFFYVLYLGFFYSSINYICIYYLFRLVEAIKKVTEIQKKRQSTYVLQRLRKGREIEQHRDIREVQRDMALIRSPAAGTLKF